MLKSILIISMLFLSINSITAQPNYLDSYNVVWNSPSVDKTGQMPIGNGNIAAGVYAIENDNLYLLLSKNDNYTCNGDIFKTGLVEISLKPNPFIKGKPFKQTLDLKTSSIDIQADDVKIKIWADANKNLYHIEIDSPTDIEVSANAKLYKRIAGTAYNRTSYPTKSPTQDVVIKSDNSIISYYAVGDKSLFKSDLVSYDVEFMEDKFQDPYKYNTFGYLIKSQQLKLVDDKLVGENKKFDIQIFSQTKKEKNIQDWLDALTEFSSSKIDIANDWQAHCQWWTDFWNRSKIVIKTANNKEPLFIDNEGYKLKRDASDQAQLVSQTYNVFRYLMAIQSRGKVQTKFNGGILNQPLRYTKPNAKSVGIEKISKNLYFTNEDERMWGRRFTFQNQRLLYWHLLTSGDFDLMMPFFNYYLDLLPMREAITKQWFGHSGAYFRENVEPTGAERDSAPTKDKKKNHPQEKPLKLAPDATTWDGYYLTFYFTSGLESLNMMIEYVKYSNDIKFANEKLLPYAKSILTFYDKQYARDKNGKLRIFPSQVLETIWHASNPTPDIAGLKSNLKSLIDMKLGSDDDIQYWQTLERQIPDIPVKQVDGKMLVEPAEEVFSKNLNKENGELYSVFPFNQYGVAFGTEDMVALMLEHKHANKYLNICWSQEEIDMAYAGQTQRVKDGLVKRFKVSSPMCRFPIYGKENPDSCPDFDHFGSGSIALQKMLIQEGDNGKIVLFPAWPKEWDIDFKIHARYNTIIEGSLKNGKLEDLKVTPAERKKDIVKRPLL